jgi:hypothetical protein
MLIPERGPTEAELRLIEFTFPIPYSATVRQSGDGIRQPQVRFYVAKSVREEQ